jgi:Tol biopolymer transport system component
MAAVQQIKTAADENSGSHSSQSIQFIDLILQYASPDRYSQLCFQVYFSRKIGDQGKLVVLRAVSLLIGISVALVAGAMGLGHFRSRNVVAYVSLHSGNSEIYVLDVFAALSANLTRHPASDSAPDWSPDGRYLAFVSTRDRGYAHVFTFDMATRLTRQLSSGDSDDINPAWSTDGKRVAFSSNREHNWRVYVIDMACVGKPCQAQPQRIADSDSLGSRPTHPVWSSQGRVAFAVLQPNGFYGLYVSDVFLQQAERLTPGVMVDISLMWSPDGREIAFTSVSGLNQEAYTLNVETGKLANLSNHRFYDGPPVWSPDGQQLAFASARSGNIQVYVVERADGMIRKLTAGDRASNPLWSPDGRWLMTQSSQNRKVTLELIDAITGESRWVIGARTDFYSLTWQP